MTKWNPEQLKAIEARNLNVLVSASAGAGKTTVLVERLVRLVIEDGVSIDQILAMTFTEAAANEMKKRLNVQLLLQYETTSDLQLKQRLKDQIGLLQNAKISTIHSFCLSILQNYYYIIGLPVTRVNTILDNAQTALYQNEALEQILHQEALRKDPIYLSLMQLFDAMPSKNTNLANAIRKIADMANTKADPLLWIEKQRMGYAITSTKDLPLEIHQYFFQSLALYAVPLHENIILLRDYMSSHPKAESYLETLQTKARLSEQMIEALEANQYDLFQKALLTCAKNPLKAKPRNDDTYANYADPIKNCEATLLKIVYDEDKFIHDYQALEPLVHKLLDLVIAYLQAYNDKKKAVEAIDFSDMEHYALEILRAEHGLIAHRYRDTFYEIMVDEFQDSNDVQDELVRLIKKENNVFRVGDIKQSIYGFRYAKPDLMRNLIAHASEHDTVLYLAHNYRSKASIIDFNNHLFTKIMNIPGLSSSYDANDAVKFGILSQQEQMKPIEFHGLQKKMIDPDNYIHSDDFKADYIANQILDKVQNEQRKWKDFVVLVRQNSKKEVLRKIFQRLQIPCFIDVKSGFYQSNAVQLILSSLQLLIDCHDEIAICALANSTLLQNGFTELSTYRQQDHPFYETLLEHQEPFIVFIDDLRTKVDQLRITDLINEILNFNQFYHTQTSDQEKTNIDLLFQKALQFESSEFHGLQNFLRYIDQIKDEQTAEAIPIGFDADVVRVMSIHQSKGLQFPVVYLWSSSRMSKVELKETLILDETLGLGFKYFNPTNRSVTPTLTRLAIEFKKDKEELEEEMRILYVATTRAQHEMHIVDIVDDLKEYQVPLNLLKIFERKGYTSWILGAFSELLPHLFIAKAISTPWQNQPIGKIESQQGFVIQPHSKDLYDVVTPSQQKVTARNPKLNFDKTNYGFVIGTAMHQMCEILPPPPWSEELILSYAKQIQFHIQPAQIHQLLTLGANPFYQSLFTQQVYKEYDFMTKDEHQYIHGVIDLLAVGDQVHIIDYKSDHDLSKKEFVTFYSKQLQTYQKALATIYPNLPIKAYLYSFSLHDFIEIEKEPA